MVWSKIIVGVLAIEATLSALTLSVVAVQRLFVRRRNARRAARMTTLDELERGIKENLVVPGDIFHVAENGPSGILVLPSLWNYFALPQYYYDSIYETYRLHHRDLHGRTRRLEQQMYRTFGEMFNLVVDYRCCSVRTVFLPYFAKTGQWEFHFTHIYDLQSVIDQDEKRWDIVHLAHQGITGQQIKGLMALAVFLHEVDMSGENTMLRLQRQQEWSFEEMFTHCYVQNPDYPHLLKMIGPTSKACR